MVKIVQTHSYTEQEEAIRKECLAEIHTQYQAYLARIAPYQKRLVDIEMSKSPSFLVIDDNG